MSLHLYYCRWLYVFFFFKQKTAYEMRISDWSSDVCSSDLATVHGWNTTATSTRCTTIRASRHCWRASPDGATNQGVRVRGLLRGTAPPTGGAHRDRLRDRRLGRDRGRRDDAARPQPARLDGDLRDCPGRIGLPDRGDHGLDRSEEHTSELQSLMRISYAVFC